MLNAEAGFSTNTEWPPINLQNEAAVSALGFNIRKPTVQLVVVLCRTLHPKTGGSSPQKGSD